MSSAVSSAIDFSTSQQTGLAKETAVTQKNGKASQ
jgi:hypothetical protein